MFKTINLLSKFNKISMGKKAKVTAIDEEKQNIGLKWKWHKEKTCQVGHS